MADTDEIELLPIPLDRETRQRLAAFCRSCGRSPAQVAAEFVAAVLVDDEEAHIVMVPDAPKGESMH